MMTHKVIDSSPHLDAFHKLQLGWLTPRVVVNPGDLILTDVKQSEDAYVLPRYGTDAREYFLLETRYESGLINDPLYDFGLLDSGLAAYHIIEPGPFCKSMGGATAENCAPLRKPTCISSDLVWDKFANNFVRAGLRLIQPDITHKYEALWSPPKTNYSETLFGLGSLAGVDLLDKVAGGPVCPANIGDALPKGAQPLLRWSDGEASGYRLKGIKLNYTEKSTNFSVEID